MIILKSSNQVITTRNTWSDIIGEVQKYWDQDYFITDFDYGNGVYRVVMTKGCGWDGQAYRYGIEFPAEQVQELWNKGYHITNVAHDGDDWIVIMSGRTGINGQSWFTRNNWDGFTDRIKTLWDNEDQVITKIAYGNGMYCGIMGGGLNWEQRWKYIPGEITQNEINTIYTDDGYMVTDVFEVKNGLFIVLSGNTGLRTQHLYHGSWDQLTKKLTEKWDEGFFVTTIGFYRGEWFLIMSK